MTDISYHQLPNASHASNTFVLARGHKLMKIIRLARKFNSMLPPYPEQARLRSYEIWIGAKGKICEHAEK